MDVAEIRKQSNSWFIVLKELNIGIGLMIEENKSNEEIIKRRLRLWIVGAITFADSHFPLA